MSPETGGYCTVEYDPPAGVPAHLAKIFRCGHRDFPRGEQVLLPDDDAYDAIKAAPTAGALKLISGTPRAKIYRAANAQAAAVQLTEQLRVGGTDPVRAFVGVPTLSEAGRKLVLGKQTDARDAIAKGDGDKDIAAIMGAAWLLGLEITHRAACERAAILAVQAARIAALAN